MRHRRTALAAAGALALLAGAGSAQADVISDQSGGDVAQYRNVQAYSQRDGDRWTLVTRVDGGAARRSAAPTQGEPFSVAVGADGSGATKVIFAGCRGNDCALFELDPRGGSIRPLPETDDPAQSETAPGLSNGVLTFARNNADRTKTAVRIKRLGGDSPSRALAVLRHQAAVTGTTSSNAGAAFTTDEYPNESPGESRLYFKPAGGGALRTLARSGYGEENHRAHFSPTLSGARLTWGWANQNESQQPNGFALRCLVGTSSAVEGAPLPGYLESVAADAFNPWAPLLASSYRGELGGTDQVFTTAPAEDLDWGAAPRAAGIRGC